MAVEMVEEGINAIPAAMELAKKYKIEMSIIAAVEANINYGAVSKNVVREVMGGQQDRTFKTHL